jgi:hypothetical protein
MRFLASLLLASAAGSSGIDLDTLTANPPFGAGSAPKVVGAPAAAADLELRGMYRDGDKTFFSLYSIKTKQSRWVSKEDAPTDPSLPVYKSFDKETGALTIEINGQPAQVTMKSGTVAKYEAPPPPSTATEAPRGGPPLPEPGPDGKVQTPWGNFTPEQIAAYRAEREKRWQERMQQVQAEGGDPRRTRDSESTERSSRSERSSERGSRGDR